MSINCFLDDSILTYLPVALVCVWYCYEIFIHFCAVFFLLFDINSPCYPHGLLLLQFVKTNHSKEQSIEMACKKPSLSIKL
jgi:hypothetical protein